MENGALWVMGSQVLGWICWLFSSAFGVALAGAGFGAFGAGLVTKKLKDFDDKILELRQTNAAIGISGTICDAYLLVKTQYVAPLHSHYYGQLKAFEKFQSATKAQRLALGNTFYTQFDFRKFSQDPVGSERLQQLVFENLGSTIKVLHLTITLVNAMKNVEDISHQRNDYIDQWEGGKFGQDDKTKIQRYLGKPFAPNGSIDKTYKSYVDHLVNHADDCIHFSELLQTLLQVRAHKLKAELEKRTLLSLMRKPTIPAVAKWDFANAKVKGLFPDPKKYEAFDAALGQSPEVVEKKE